MNPYDTLTAGQRIRLTQLFDDILPYYSRIAIYDPDRDFIRDHKEACLRIALAGMQTMQSHPDVKPEDAIFSDDLFSAYIAEAWTHCLTDADRHFLNDHLQHAAECFRMGFMMADLPEMI